MSTSDASPLTIRKDDEGRLYLVGDWPKRAVFTLNVLRDPYIRYVRLEGDRIAVEFHDRQGVYKLLAIDELLDRAYAEFIGAS